MCKKNRNFVRSFAHSANAERLAVSLPPLLIERSVWDNYKQQRKQEYEEYRIYHQPYIGYAE